MATRLKNYFKMENSKNPYCFDNSLTKSPTQPITPPHHYQYKNCIHVKSTMYMYMYLKAVPDIGV